MDCKAVLALAVVAVILACAPHEASAFGRTEMRVRDADQRGHRRGDNHKAVLGSRWGRTIGEGFIYVPPRSPEHEYFEFIVNSLSQGWRCDFEYTSAATGVVHTANVLVWEGMLSKRASSTDNVDDSLISIATVPCFNCIWKIQADGFYRADDKNHDVFTKLAGWTPA